MERQTPFSFPVCADKIGTLLNDYLVKDISNLVIDYLGICVCGRYTTKGTLCGKCRCNNCGEITEPRLVLTSGEHVYDGMCPECRLFSTVKVMCSTTKRSIRAYVSFSGYDGKTLGTMAHSVGRVSIRYSNCGGLHENCPTCHRMRMANSLGILPRDVCPVLESWEVGIDTSRDYPAEVESYIYDYRRYSQLYASWIQFVLRDYSYVIEHEWFGEIHDEVVPEVLTQTSFVPEEYLDFDPWIIEASRCPRRLDMGWRPWWCARELMNEAEDYFFDCRETHCGRQYQIDFDAIAENLECSIITQEESDPSEDIEDAAW